VEGDVLFLGRDPDMIAKAIQELRSICLRIDRRKVDLFDEPALLGPIGLWIHIDALARLPAASEPTQGPEIRERVRIDIEGLSEHIQRRGVMPGPPV
jgi:hypothetical protein